MDCLECMLKRWAIVFVEDVAPNLDDEVRPDPDHVAIERPVMDRAHGHSIGNDWLAAFRILLDVRGVEEFRVAKSAQRALRVVSHQNALAKYRLMKSTTNDRLGVLAAESDVCRVLQAGGL
jgi:hypothetical protein